MPKVIYSDQAEGEIISNSVCGKGMAEHKISEIGSSHHGAVETNPTRNHEVAGVTPGLVQWVKDPALP